MSEIAYLLLPDESHRRLMLGESGGLPIYGGGVPDWFNVVDLGRLRRVIQERFGIDTSLLHASRFGETWVFALENRGGNGSAGRWLESTDLTHLDGESRAIAAAWFQSPATDAVYPWANAGWFVDAEAWIVAESGMSDPTIDMVKTSGTGIVLRVSGDNRASYFKAVTRRYMRDLEIAETLKSWHPTNVPQVIAADTGRRWFLMADMGGVDLSETREIDVWCDAVRAYARLQKESLARLDEAVKGGFGDYRPEPLRRKLRDVAKRARTLARGSGEDMSDAEYDALESVLPRLEDACRQPDDYAVPYAIEHGDFHAGNIRVTDNGFVFYDWSWSMVSHPFLSATTLLHLAKWMTDDQRAAVRDAYLTEWTDDEPMPRLRDLFELICKWSLLVAVVVDGEWVEALWEELGWKTPHPYSASAYMLERRQHYFLQMLRRMTDYGNTLTTTIGKRGDSTRCN
ncbi:MAG: aminoglycoside phosphotransferase family protein [Candidatus Poribacteria bacterium]|nr:aminoglycoside phosphotransferase family protein [Candidatus Poribacteria bacterium]